MTHAVDAAGCEHSPAPDGVGRAAQSRTALAWAPWLLAGILAVGLFFHLWGIQRDLPYINDDATWIVNPAIWIAATGDLNPHVFGNPGSTLIYPLAGIYHVWNAAAHNGSWFHPDASLRTISRIGSGDPRLPEFHLLARLLTVVYALLSILLVYRVGCVTFDTQAALLAALFTALYPSEVFDKMVRPDSASLFFALFGVWCCVLLWRRPTIATQMLAGVAIGLGIGTKYYLGTQVAVLLLVEAMILWRRWSQPHVLRAAWVGSAIGLSAVAVGFILSTPYFFLDHVTALRDLKVQMRSSHPGADGLTPIGNLLWYLSMLPANVSWPQCIAAAVGVVLVLWKRAVEQALPLVFTATFLIGISSSGLHWNRWLVPVLPVVALLAAHAVLASVTQLSRRLDLPRPVQLAALVVMIVVCCQSAVERLVQIDRLHSRPSTSVLARQWMMENLPRGSRIAFEWETLPPPLRAEAMEPSLWITRDARRNLTELSMSKLGVRGSVDWYRQRSYRYLVTSNLYYTYYPENADRYPKEAEFYRQLLREGRLIYEVSPSTEHQGPEIRIYEIQKGAGSSAPAADG